MLSSRLCSSWAVPPVSDALTSALVVMAPELGSALGSAGPASAATGGITGHRTRVQDCRVMVRLRYSERGRCVHVGQGTG